MPSRSVIAKNRPWSVCKAHTDQRYARWTRIPQTNSTWSFKHRSSPGSARRRERPCRPPIA